MALRAGSAAAPARTPASGARGLAAAGALLLLAALMLGSAIAAIGGASPGQAAAGQGGGTSMRVSRLAQSEIPPSYLLLYQAAGKRYGLDWSILAAIGEVECHHGRDPDPSCGHEGAVNSAGAGGPMQFIASTWVTYGVDGDGDGRADRWDPSDAIYAAANYLRASGAPGDYRRAIFAYNKAGWYVNLVEAWAARYRGSASSTASPVGEPASEDEGEGGGQGEGGEGEGWDARLQALTATPVRFIAGARAMLAAGGRHLAMVPTGVPVSVQALVVAGNELQGLPYGPGGHPDPRGAHEEDCSSTVNYVLYRAGIRPIAEILRLNPLAQDYVRWGLPGPGRWVSVYATTVPTDHTFIVIAGLRLDTSHNGTDVGPSAGEDGPRWRILDHIPTWAHWSVRHPPGL